MWASRDLEVRPVRRYAEPRYPAAIDFYGVPDGQPGWRQQVATPTLATALLTAVFTAGCERQPAAPQASAPAPAPVVDTTPQAPVAGVATAAPTEEPPAEPADAGAPPVATSTPDNLPPIDREAVLARQGPFSWKASGLPISWMPYGTGAPARLSEEQARKVVEREFARAGIRLRRNVEFERPGIACELDGYDERKHIGYEFVTWPELEDPKGYRGEKEGDRSKMISHDEIQRIMQREIEGKEHVAIISWQDNRFSWAGHPNRGTTEAAALQALSAQLRKYIAWLRSQGAL